MVLRAKVENHFKYLEATIDIVLKKLLLKISQYSQENIRVGFL